jgi:hypothetical protein
MAIESLGEIVEIDIPYKVAAARYGTAVAEIMGHLAKSDANRAKKMNADEFRWYLGYRQAEDPVGVIDEAVFFRALVKDSTIWLIARGGRWRGAYVLTTLPPQIEARFAERAKLICGQTASPVKAQPGDVAPGTATTTAADVENALAEWIKSHPKADRGLLAVIRFALQQLFRGAD